MVDRVLCQSDMDSLMSGKPAELGKRVLEILRPAFCHLPKLQQDLLAFLASDRCVVVLTTMEDLMAVARSLYRAD